MESYLGFSEDDWDVIGEDPRPIARALTRRLVAFNDARHDKYDPPILPKLPQFNHSLASLKHELNTIAGRYFPKRYGKYNPWFALFDHLPKELRDRIWSASNNQDIITIHPLPLRQFILGTSNLFGEHLNRPAGLATCSESRKVLLQNGAFCFATQLVQPVYFNSATSTIHFLKQEVLSKFLLSRYGSAASLRSVTVKYLALGDGSAGRSGSYVPIEEGEILAEAAWKFSTLEKIYFIVSPNCRNTEGVKTVVLAKIEEKKSNLERTFSLILNGHLAARFKIPEILCKTIEELEKERG